jgi:hypothetical protein
MFSLVQPSRHPTENLAMGTRVVELILLATNQRKTDYQLLFFGTCLLFVNGGQIMGSVNKKY